MGKTIDRKLTLHEKTRQKHIKILSSLGYSKQWIHSALDKYEDKRGVINKNRWIEICRGEK